MKDKITVGQFLGDSFVENFAEFDITEIRSVLDSLRRDDAIDIAHAEMLQQKSLYAAELVVAYIAKLVKTTSYLEVKINSAKNKIALEYRSADGKTTADMKKQAGESAPAVEDLALQLAKAKGSKLLLERYYDLLIKSHHHFKDISSAHKKGIVGTSTGNIGWE